MVIIRYTFRISLMQFRRLLSSVPILDRYTGKLLSVSENIFDLAISQVYEEIFPSTIMSMIPNADYARDTFTRRSCTGFVFFLAHAPLSWQTRQQPSVALSTIESEFGCMCRSSGVCVVNSTFKEIWMSMNGTS